MTPPAAPASRVIHHVATVDSTQEAVFALASAGAPDGAAVVADTQTAGRGRHGRRWHDEAGTSLLVSVLLRPALPPSLRPLLSYAASVAVVGTLGTLGLDARVKWPNDVLVAGRKVAGILLEAREGVVVVGVGLNVNQQRFPPELAARATSVALETGRATDRGVVLATLLDELDRWRACLEREGFAPVRERWRAVSDTLGRGVRVADVAGVAVDLDASGALVVDAAGGRRRVVAGELVQEG
jgi:BirA family biotin operon repressor/biotin-[acetyl-CoA-carboxylase] ligase